MKNKRILFYDETEGLNFDDEIEKIKLADEVHLKFDATKKSTLFLLGILFAAGKKIRILNYMDLDYNNEKSFNKMALFWFYNQLQPRIKNEPVDNAIFLICPVRKATDEQKEFLSNYKKEKMEEGYSLHYPAVDTEQNKDPIGYNICTDNANAIGGSNSIHIYYDNSSKGTLFDLGVAYYLNKELKLINEDTLTFDDSDYFDMLVKRWSSKSKGKERIK